LLIRYSEIFDFPIPGGSLTIINCLIRRRKLFAYTYATHMLKPITEPGMEGKNEFGLLFIYLVPGVKENILILRLSESDT